jgi:outer membrane receptor protein involved in Fe transport
MSQLTGACVVGAAACVFAANAGACSRDARALVADIPSLPLVQALNQFAGQTQLQWASGVDLTARPGSRAVRAGTKPERALQKMLRGTGLQFECLNARMVSITSLPPRPVAAAQTEPEPEEVLPEVEVVAVVAGRENQPTPTDSTVYLPADIAQSGIKGMDELGLLTPGVEFDYFSTVGGGVYTNLAIRGVTDRHGNTAGVWFDDIPLPAAASNSFARGFPFTFDMARTEILRGPQPVLLGANAQGGAVQFIPAVPSLTSSDGRVHVERAVTEGGDPTHEVAAVAGGPLQDGRLGLRVSGWYRSEGGFVDRVDPFTRAVVQGNSNRTTSKSARVALRLDPGEGVTLIPSIFYQSTAVRDSSAFMIYASPAYPDDTMSDPAAGVFHNGSLISQPFRDSYYLGSLKALASFEGSQLQSVTGYFHRAAHMRSDDTEAMRWQGFGNPRGNAYPSSHDDLITTDATLAQRAFTQQLQLTSTGTGRLSWVVGGFFADTRGRETDHVYAVRTPAVVRAYGFDVLDKTVPTTTSRNQMAGFGQFTWRMDRRLKFSAGLRLERHEVDTDSEDFDRDSGPSLEFHDHRADTVLARQVGLTWNATDPQGRRTREYYLYSATGYAPGSVDAARPTCWEIPAVYPTDTLSSFELGTRQGWRGRMQLDLNLFRVNWDNGPEARRTCLFMHLPGRARSQGFGLAAQAELGRGLEARLATSYVDARYTQTLRNDGNTTVIDVFGVIPPDDRLIVSAGDAVGTPPQVTSPWSITASIGKRIALAERRSLDLRLEGVYHSRNHGPFYTDHPDAMYPANLASNPGNSLLNLRATLKAGELDLALFVNNLLDARPVLLKRNKGNDVNTLFYATTFRPRTIGLSATWNFAGSWRKE